MIAGTTVNVSFDLWQATLLVALIIVAWVAATWTPRPRTETIRWAELRPGDVIYTSSGDTFEVRTHRRDYCHDDATRVVDVDAVRDDDGTLWRTIRDEHDPVTILAREEVPA